MAFGDWCFSVIYILLSIQDIILQCLQIQLIIPASFSGLMIVKDRSLMNVPFVTGDKELDAKFVKEAEAAGLVNLKGHRTVGGMRASIYNAMPEEGVVKLVEFMKKFEAEHADA